MSRFPKARPSARPSRAMPKRPRDWRARTHVCVNLGSLDYDDVPLCAECGFRSDHAIHDLTAPAGAAEVDQRIMGESA
jgi:hypothetical protein